MNRTKIEWVKNPYWEWTDDIGTIHISGGEQGFTWNPITGCLNGCPYCYARKLANGRLKQRYLANHNFPNYLQVGFPHTEEALFDPFYPRFWEDRIQELAKRNDLKPRGIFVCDMGELFGGWIPTNWQWNVFEVIKHNPQHRFYLLTHQPQELRKFSPFPPNCWVGVTATNLADYRYAILHLSLVEARVKFLSIEPFLSPIHLIANDAIQRGFLDWIIIGAMTCKAGDILHRGNKYPELKAMPYGKIWTLQPKLEWVLEIVKTADKAGIPVFLKENLVPMIADSLDPAKLKLYPDGMHLRQEMPEEKNE